MGNFLARNGATFRAVCHSLLADCESDDRRIDDKLLEVRDVAGSMAEDALVDVQSCIVAVMHGTTAPLNARPVVDVANGVMDVGVRCPLLEL